MKLSKFKYKLPEELITAYPTEHRDESRLMVINRQTEQISHCLFKDLYKYFTENDLLIFNDAKVFPARMFGNKEKTGASIEVFLLRELNHEQRLWDALVEPARKIRIGNKLYFGEDESLVAEVIDNTTSRGRTLRFLFEGNHEAFKAALYTMGEAPIPATLKRKVEPLDAERYQTIYAKNEGAVSAPHAGLHFSRELLKHLEIEGVHSAYITLYIGLGSFRSIDVEDLTKHKIDSEQVYISEEAAQLVNTTKAQKKNICAVGLSVMRAVESSISTQQTLKAYSGWTNKFIYPPYEFNIANRLVTNFHLPLSIPFILTSTFAGHELLMKAYKIAIKEQYRFGPYGDAMLIL